MEKKLQTAHSERDWFLPTPDELINSRWILFNTAWGIDKLKEQKTKINLGRIIIFNAATRPIQESCNLSQCSSCALVDLTIGDKFKFNRETGCMVSVSHIPKYLMWELQGAAAWEVIIALVSGDIFTLIKKDFNTLIFYSDTSKTVQQAQ